MIYQFYYKALQTLPIWNVKIILLLIPIVTLFYDFFFAGAVPGPGRIIGTIIVLLSAVLVIGTQHKKQQEEDYGQRKSFAAGTESKRDSISHDGSNW